MDYKTLYYPESRFGGFTDVDGTIAFYLRVNSLLAPSSVVLDVGCGRGESADDPVRMRRDLRILKGKCARVIGIDVDDAALANPFLDEFRFLRGTRWPLDDATVDICVCDNVLEHIEDVDLFFSEGLRVLRKGGYMCIRTPNAISYVGIASRLLPNRFHASLLGKVQVDRREEDVFPTYYRCNTIGRLSKILARYGFEPCVYGHESEPSYLSFSRLFYFLGVIHQRFSPNRFKVVLFAIGRKK